MAEQKQGPSKEQRHEAWSKALGHVMTEDLTWAERAAHILVILADQDDHDNGETVADLRRVMERGLDSLAKKGRLKLERGRYTLVTEQADQRKAMAVDSDEPVAKAEPEPEAGERPEVA